MAVIKVEHQGEPPQETTISFAAEAPRSASAVTKVQAAAGWAFRAGNAERLARYQRLAAPLARSLSRSLGAFSKALGQFQWPAGASVNTGRVVVRDPVLDSAATATLQAAGQAPRQEKLLSLARASGAATTLASAGADTGYAITLTQGGESRTVTVTVPAGADWQGVLQATADAINAADLPMQASVVRQSFAGQKLAGVNKIGSFLNLTVNPAHADQDVAISDHSGNLVRSLGLKPTEQATTPAIPTRYDLRIDRLAKSASRATSVQDHRADSGLAAGEYKLAYDLGDASGVLSVDLEAGMTWDQVLRRTANAINSSPAQLRAEVKDARRVSGLDRSDAYWTDGAYLEVSLASPKLGQRLSLSEQGGDWLGLQSTANPGSDARIQVNGRTLVSETGVFSLDQGRVNLAVHGTTGETRAVTVVEAGDEMASRLSAIVESYNDLSILLSRNADLLDAGFPASFRDPVADLVPGIANLGLVRTPDSTLSFSPAAFTSGMERDPAGTRALLLDPATGLLTRWARAADAARDGGAAKALLPPSLLADLGPPAAEQLRLEQSGRLLDVMESTAKGASRLPDLQDTTAALSGLARAKRSGLAKPLLPEGIARLLKLHG